MAASTTPTPASVASSTGAKPGPKGPERMTGAQAIVRTLEDLGTDLVFGIPGGAVLPLYDAINRS
ncbi:thiamine pyrophosphate-binding protein, partial [Corynebacterium casei]